jgi:hypothetical protein
MPSTPREWLDYLVAKLDTRWYGTLWAYDAYYESDQALAFMTRKFREAYGTLFADLADNYMPLVVESKAERLKVQGFRFGTSQEADDDAWEIWQANGLDGQSNMVHTEAIKLGMAYWMVQPNGEMPRITAEHPSQVIVEHAPGDRRTRLAGLKKWVDGEFIYANVYLPDRVVKYRTTSRLLRLERGERRWQTIGAASNPLREVPIIEVPNNPSMLRGGKSDLAGGPLRIQDAINKFLCDILVGSEYQAFPQRVLLGVEQPKGADGKPIPLDQLDRAAQSSRLWMFPGQDAKAFEFSAAELKNIRDVLDGSIGDLAAQTRIPIYYFRPQAISNISAEALVGLDAGLVSKVNDAKEPFDEAHEDTMRLAFKARDPQDERASEVMAETIWKNTESRSEAQLVDAAVKKQTIGVPWEQLMEDLGYSPQQIDRMAGSREADALLNALTNPGGFGAGEPAQPAANGAVPPEAAPVPPQG